MNATVNGGPGMRRASRAYGATITSSAESGVRHSDAPTQQAANTQIHQ